ncbi:alr1p [Saccharomyces arboricola H-6]|uniref:Alr1p n=1 Tax=Saccharomyces arboricola (strain H-6 / AS 2.3317 / CBS 10644) TaxID=1160507 RepID=J8Q2I5_SACAR|nr:alr1p [Saccharomyces arboricola H-6]
MSSSSSSLESSPNLSRSNSLVNTMVSMKTEDHTGLYDHRKHPDSLAIHHETPPLKQDEIAKSRKPSTSEEQKNPAKYSKHAEVANTSTRGHMDFGDGAETVPHHQLRASAILTSNARPSRLAHSMPHQRQLYVESSTHLPPKDVGVKRDYTMSPLAVSSSNKSKLSVPSSISSAAKVRKTSLVNPILEVPLESKSDTHSKQAKPKKRTYSTTSTHSSVNPTTLLAKSISQKSDTDDDTQERKPVRMNTRASFDSDVSQGSRDSQETEEDVCFPMSPQLHTRVNGVDFDELEEYAQFAIAEKSQFLASLQGPGEQKFSTVSQDIGFTSSTSTSGSSAALKYTPRISQTGEKSDSTNETDAHEKNKEETEDVKPDLRPGVSFGKNKVEGEDNDDNIPNDPTYYSYQNTDFQIPNRFSFFCSESDETVHASDIPSLVSEGQTFYELFRGGEPTWWLDCSCPTDDEMRCIAKAFGIHPLTAEDIRMQETREKVELFKSYYFVCFHTFENDKESEDFLEPINVYIVVCRSGVLTFHFGPISHCANVRRRVRQLRDYVNVNSDWLCYALIDDITDSFAPVIQSIEYEADSIEDSVFMARDMDFAAMLQRIGESRRKTMTLMRLLSGKADVIKMFAKRCQDEANGIGPALTSQINIANLQSRQDNANRANNNSHSALPNNYAPTTSQPRGDIALYLGDIQDHLLTMFQNLLAYEKIFSRSHTNYLAQLQVESFNSNNKVTEMLGKVTMIGTMLVPLNVITGLFGMNVKVPGENSSIAWWFGILGVLLLLATVGWFMANFWIKRIDPPATLNEAAESGAKSVISSFLPKRNKRFNDRSKNVNVRVGPSNRSVASLPSRYSRYD